jgi:hypothetical protein
MSTGVESKSEIKPYGLQNHTYYSAIEHNERRMFELMLNSISDVLNLNVCKTFE